jgi:hypothetical protein
MMEGSKFFNFSCWFVFYTIMVLCVMSFMTAVKLNDPWSYVLAAALGITWAVYATMFSKRGTEWWQIFGMFVIVFSGVFYGFAMFELPIAIGFVAFIIGITSLVYGEHWGFK